MSMNEWKTEILVVGGGAAGMMAAGTAAEAGKRVMILEHTSRLGKKLYITGKGRCNVTNHCPPEEVLQNIPRNSRFLYSALWAFPPEETMAFFERHGCQLKTERGNRVFPVSDKSASVVDALTGWLRRTGVETVFADVRELWVEDGTMRGVLTDKGPVEAERVILCTGGCSYPLTGSTGDGYRMASAVGHTIVPPRGSLVPLEACGQDLNDCREMMGLSLRNVAVRLLGGKKKAVFSDFGELLFTHFGLSGPTILSASAHMDEKQSYIVEIDLKPALEEKKLDERLLRDFEKYQNRDFANALSDLLPRAMIPVVVRRSGVPPETKIHEVTRQQRRALLEILKGFTVEIAGKRPVEEAVVTAGGVKVSEVDPKTMASKKLPGLYLAGELLDVDAYTGGFNLQIAWATGRAAGLAAAESL
jgi:predicted Rossmann fold flavoprotein